MPLAPVNARVVTVTATSMTIDWDPNPNSNVSGYVLEWTTNTLTKRTSIRNSQFQINGMLAGREYTINIYSRNKDNARSTTSTSVVGSTCETLNLQPYNYILNLSNIKQDQ